MEIDLSKIPYKHRFAAASMLMSKGNRLTGLMSLSPEEKKDKDILRVLAGISYYDMALSLMKRHDGNCQLLLNWKCQALISIGQYQAAREWYKELLQIAAESEGPNGRGAYARLASEQIAILGDKPNDPLPSVDRLETKLFDDPPFCTWAEQICGLFIDRKFKLIHQNFSAQLRETISLAALKKLWTTMVGSASSSVDISLERFEFSSESDNESHVGWCYFSVFNDEISEAISMDVYKTKSDAFEIGQIEFGRP